MNSTAFFFTKHLVGLRAAPSHKLNHLLYLQGSENQRGSSSGARPSRDFSLTASARSYTRGTAGVPAQPLPAAGPFGHPLGHHSGCGRSHGRGSPGTELSLPTPAPAPGGLGSIAVRAFAPSRRCGGCTSLLPAASSPFLPPSCLAPSGGSAEGSPPPRHPAGPPLPSGPERVRCQVPAPPGPAGPCARGQRRKRGLRHSGARWDTGALSAGQGTAKRRPRVPPRRESGAAGLGPAVPAPAAQGRHAAPTHLPQAPAPRAGPARAPRAGSETAERLKPLS
ncbi:proline-rich proteoglycan 2-like [Melozone crissalis]|uniref:proline-rich proteoglycan 2-like n=1 Tax=Melozone crissalis TaxID=40204 RepID=UPI0023DADAFC|nr:proline-rich proteoglycan 2-like [Melozone crissalis]